MLDCHAAIANDHCRRAGVDTGRTAGGDGAIGAECRFQPCEALQRGLGTIAFVGGKSDLALAAFNDQGLDLFGEPACSLGAGKTLLALGRECILRFARNGELSHQVFGVPAGVL